MGMSLESKLGEEKLENSSRRWCSNCHYLGQKGVTTVVTFTTTSRSSITTS